jgi:hypothetical protein
MSNVEIVELAGGIIAIVLAAISTLRTSVLSLTDAAVIVLGAVFILIAIL